MAEEEDVDTTRLCDYCGKRAPSKWWSGIIRKYCSKECHAAAWYRVYVVMTCFMAIMPIVSIGAILLWFGYGGGLIYIRGLVEIVLWTFGGVVSAYLAFIGYKEEKRAAKNSPI